MRRTLARELPAQRAGLDGHGPGLGAPPAHAGHASRSWSSATGPGLAQVVVKDPATVAAGHGSTARRRSSRSPARSRPTRRRPVASRSSTPAFEALTEPSATPPVELWRPTLTAGLPTPARPRRGHPAAPDPAGRAGRSRRPACAASGRRWTPGTSPRCTAPSWSPRPPRAARRVRGRLLRPAGLPRAVAAALQAGAGRGVRAGLRGRAGVPGRAARHGPAPRGVRLARRRARLRPRPPRRGGGAARRGRRAWSRRCTSTPSEAVELLGVDVPVVPEALPVLHFREALEIAGAPADEPDLAPGARAGDRRVGRCASTAATWSSSRATRPRAGRSTATPTRRTRTGRARST